jgi:hypothetical protein
MATKGGLETSMLTRTANNGGRSGKFAPTKDRLSQLLAASGEVHVLEKVSAPRVLDTFITCYDYDPAVDPGINTATFTAQMRVGNNSTTNPWELAMNGTNSQYVNHVWNVSGGYLDDDNVFFELSIEDGGSASSAGLTVGTDFAQASGPSFNSIDEIGITAEVSGAGGPLYFEWKSMQMTFYDSANTPTIVSVDSPCLPTAQLNSGAATNQFRVYFPPPGQVRAVLDGTYHIYSADPAHKKPPQLGQLQIAARVYIWTS